MENKGEQSNEVDDLNKMMAGLEFYVNDENPKKCLNTWWRTMK